MANITQLLYSWYNKNKRDLPWRKTTDPYKIWLSEVILQQTRIDQGTDYYYKFINYFPDVFSLARADESEVLKLWMGLGYYSRARNLHHSAKFIVDNYGGKFPDTYSNILSLKGIGTYTAAAIASIAFNQPYPVLDGNVHRFLSRYFGMKAGIDTAAGKKMFLNVASELMPQHDPGYHNQAVMEFGALQCVPVSPHCENCPLVSSCYAYEKDAVKQLPVKSKKAEKRNRYFYFFLVEDNDHIWLEKRSGNDIWKNLYQFPLTETIKVLNEDEIFELTPAGTEPAQFNLKFVSPVQQHILTHQILHARIIHLEVIKAVQANKKYMRVKIEELHKYAVPRLIEKLAKNIENIKFTTESQII